MQAEMKQEFVSVADYLSGEERGEVKHEYIAGTVYAMAGATSDHNQIAGNIYAALRSRLHKGPCRAFILDLKVRLKIDEETVFYYPDVMVGCDPRDTHKLYLCFPRLIVEVSSESTERLDRREKKSAYQTIETLEEYVIVAQERVEATLFRRANNWQPEIFNQLHDTLTLTSIDLALALSSVYEGVVTPN
jgi:Uma2 family endonuclease